MVRFYLSSPEIRLDPFAPVFEEKGVDGMQLLQLTRCTYLASLLSPFVRSSSRYRLSCCCR